MSNDQTLNDLLRLMKENFDLVHNRLDTQTAAMSEIRGDIRALTGKVEQNSAEIKDLRAELSEFKTEVRREFRELKLR